MSSLADPLAPPPFQAEDHAAHLARVQDDLARQGLRAGVLFDPEGIYWLTGYQSIGYFTFQCLVVPAEGRPALVSRRVNEGLARATPALGGFLGIEDTADPVSVLAEALAARTAAGDGVGLETSAWYLTVQAYLALTRSLPRRFVEWGTVVDQARIRKTPAQLACMRHAARAAVAGLHAAAQAIAPGRTENDLAAAMLGAATAAGSEYVRVPLVVAGPTTGQCFATWRRRPLRPGDAVLLEAAGCVHRHHAMIARGAVVGRASPAQRRHADVIIEALDRAIEAIRPGVRSADVDAACRAVFERAGLGEYFAHRTGYGIGIGFPPNWAEGRIYALRPGDPLVLEPGMAFHLVPSLFRPDLGMVFSESVVVTDAGCEVLTQYPRRLIETG
jgi:Xaa-Pro dipeptidase